MKNCEIKLTQTVQKGGCAAKVAAHELRKILAGVSFPAPHAEILVDGSTFDDAAVYQLDPSRAMVQTLDFFTPIVDTPSVFGKIAAANALSDIYAMGGTPKTAMVILAFPLSEFPTELVSELLQGISDKVKESGACIVGGHSIDDASLKCGLSVTGFVDPKQIWTNSGAKAGDVLILTKPLGTGTATAALKRQAVTEDGIEDVLQSMMLLNDVPTLLAEGERLAVHAATDITGFGLSGHVMQLAKESGVSINIDTSRLPLFSRTEEFIRSEYLTKAHTTNAQYTAMDCDTSKLSPLQRHIINDPQTSGGLLLSVTRAQSESLLASLRQRFPCSAVIGEVVSSAGKGVRFF